MGMTVLQTPLCIVATAVVLIVVVTAEPTLNCTAGYSGNEYIADDVDLCVYYHCRDGLRTIEWPADCAKGTRLPSYYNKSVDNPCTEIVLDSKCLRCDIHDVQRKPDIVTDYCNLWTPCEAGCICHNEIEGYWCDCSGPLSTLPALPTYSHQCRDPAYCSNGGTCYKLYDEEPYCDCVSGWTGKRCESKLCDWNPCMHNGTCILNGTQIYCQCDTCWKGSCCEIRRTEDPDCNNCSACAGGENCTGIRTWLCECYPCPSAEYICSKAGLNKVRDCNLGAATAGSRFTLMFEQNYYSGGEAQSALEVYITAGAADGRPRAVNVSAPRATPGCRFLQSLVIPPGGIAKVDVPIACRHDGTGLLNNGILVQENNNDTVTVYGINRAAFSADSFLALPDRRAGVAFVAVAYPSFNNQNATDHQTQLGIVATVDSTMVNISLSTPTDIPGSTSDSTYIVRLNAFQTYQIQGSKPGADLSGTIIVSSKPIHVFSGNMRTSVLVNRSPAGTLSTDHLVEEIPPADTWGKTFAIVPIPRTVLGYSQTMELIRLVASFDTTCTLYNSTGQQTVSISTLNDWFIQFPVDASDNFFLDCSQPVLIMEITTSADERLPGLQNDPAMLYVPAVNQYSNYYVFAAPTYSQTGGPYGTTLAVLAANSSIYQQIQVNNVLTSALPQFKPWRRIAPNLPISNENDRPPLYGGIFNIPNGETSTIRHPVKQVAFMCLIYCYDNRESVGHVAGSSLSSTNDLDVGTGLSQWEYVKRLNYTFIN